MKAATQNAYAGTKSHPRYSIAVPHQQGQQRKHHVTKANVVDSHHAYGTRYNAQPTPKFKIPSKGQDAKAAYQLIHDELSLDGNPSLNLASFVHTWMPEEADKLMIENMNKNLIDQDEYPITTSIHSRCVSILADLWHAPHSKQAIGTATTGSSEAIQLGGLAMKRIWQEKRKAAGKSIQGAIGRSSSGVSTAKSIGAVNVAHVPKMAFIP